MSNGKTKTQAGKFLGIMKSAILIDMVIVYSLLILPLKNYNHFKNTIAYPALRLPF
ncbi:hypothetical protein CIT292_09213 [Citrobacter youngae ATCC 29220]|uniref:RDD domain-containing protein n=1 Tax=Citrobacter youngae ATCC 29220 TaxID=500640 RepID=D4BG42_9ENTR|nr:hypothetical protein CIT292_09213 [Citrobacter youngae ATCC 29220]